MKEIFNQKPQKSNRQAQNAGLHKRKSVKTKLCTVEDLEIRIHQLLNAIPKDSLLKVVRFVPGRFMKLVKANGEMVHTLKYEYLILFAKFL